jgi:hypothetical protein
MLNQKFEIDQKIFHRLSLLPLPKDYIISIHNEQFYFIREQIFLFAPSVFEWYLHHQTPFHIISETPEQTIEAMQAIESLFL